VRETGKRGTSRLSFSFERTAVSTHSSSSENQILNFGIVPKSNLLQDFSSSFADKKEESATHQPQKPNHHETIQQTMTEHDET
jgi:hypothetical protein